MPSDDGGSSGQHRIKPSVSWFGVSLILIGLFFLATAGQIEELGFVDENDPGPRAIPVLLSIMLLVGGLIEVATTWLRGGLPPAAAVTGEHGEGRFREVVILLGVLLVYVLAVPWAGFYVSTLIFATVVPWRLGARWWVSLVASVALLLVVRVLFVGLFRVQLPSGLFRM